MSNKKQPFWKRGKTTAEKVIHDATNFAKKQDEYVDYYDDLVYNTGALTESNLVNAEELMREFINENGKPISLFSDSHTINGDDTTYSNLLADKITSGYELDLTHQLKYAIDYGTEIDKKYYWSIATSVGTADTCDISSGDGLSITSTTNSPTMTKFKRGDRVTPTKDFYPQKCSGYENVGSKKLEAGKCYIVAHSNFTVVEEKDYKPQIDREGEWPEVGSWLVCNMSEMCYFIPYSPTTTMGVLSMARDFILGEPEASFKKAGITDNNGHFTEDTRIAFLENLMRADAKTENGYLQTLAKQIIAKQEKDCCKK